MTLPTDDSAVDILLRRWGDDARASEVRADEEILLAAIERRPGRRLVALSTAAAIGVVLLVAAAGVVITERAGRQPSAAPSRSCTQQFVGTAHEVNDAGYSDLEVNLRYRGTRTCVIASTPVVQLVGSDGKVVADNQSEGISFVAYVVRPHDRVDFSINHFLGCGRVPTDRYHLRVSAGGDARSADMSGTAVDLGTRSGSGGSCGSTSPLGDVTEFVVTSCARGGACTPTVPPAPEPAPLPADPQGPPLTGPQRRLALHIAHFQTRMTIPAGDSRASVEGWPANVTAVSALVTSSGAAARYVGGSTSATGRVVVVRLIGSFVDYGANIPPGATAPTGNVISVVVGLASRTETDYGIETHHPAENLPHSTQLFRRRP